jgi:hypothetical protein
MLNFGRAQVLRAALLGSVAATAMLSATSSFAATTPDGVTPASVVDTANTQPYWVGLAIRNEGGNSGGTCTGLLINPRTVLFAAHCVDGLAPGAYDAPTAPGNRAAVGYTTDPTLGRTNLREFLFGLDFVVPAGDARVMTASSVMVWYDPRSRFGSAALPSNGTFLPADVAIAGFGTPNELLGRDAVNGMALLFSPVSGPVPIVIGGYGQSGNGFDGTRTSSTAEAFSSASRGASNRATSRSMSGSRAFRVSSSSATIEAISGSAVMDASSSISARAFASAATASATGFISACSLDRRTIS